MSSQTPLRVRARVRVAPVARDRDLARHVDAQQRIGQTTDGLEILEPPQRLGGRGHDAVLGVHDRHPGPAAGGRAGRLGDERQPQRAAHHRSDRLDERDLVLAEAAGRPGAVQLQQPPAAPARIARRAQLGVGVHERPQLAPPRAALRTPAGRGVEVGDLPRAPSEVGELVEVGDLELVLPERGAHGVGKPMHDAGPHGQHGVRVRRSHEQAVDRDRAAHLLGDALDEALGRQPRGGERIDPPLRAREVAGGAA
jgi:hypothetical protein